MQKTTFKIILIRHGKPDIWLLPSTQKKISIKEMNDFLIQYDFAAIDKDFKPNEKIYKSLQQIKFAFTSEMKRAKATFQYCQLNVNVVSNNIFNEAGLPLFDKSLLKLKPKTWIALLRTLWFMGFSNKCDPKNTIKLRASKATDLLLNEAQNNDCIALFGHGVFNYFLKKQLLSKGGVLQSTWDYGYWACNEIAFP